MGVLGERETRGTCVVSRPNSLPLPFRTPATQANSAVESKAFRLREVFGPTGPIQSGKLRWGDRLGSSYAFVTREVERHADSGAVFPL